MGHSEGPSVLSVDGLTVDYWNDGTWWNVVNHARFEVRRGEAFGLIGESGCGKTTTAYSLLGYRRPSSRLRAGRVLLKGSDMLALDQGELRRLRGREISLVPQDPTTALNPAIKVGSQVNELMAVHGVGGTDLERRQRTLALFDQVGLPSPARALDRYPHQFSGGQRQRIMIAMSLACDPDVVVLDEPTTGLDVSTQSQILDLLKRLRADRAMTMVYVTHNLGVVGLICDRVGVMYAGEVVEDASTDELFRNPRHPYTRGLIGSMPRIATPRLTRQAPLRGILRRDELPPGCRFAPRCDFATPECYTEPQQLSLSDPDHEVACWRWPAVARGQLTRAIPAEARLGRATPAAAPLLEVRELDLAYEYARLGLFGPRSPRLVVHDAAFAIRPRETLAIVGESGSGKSTIARAVAGLLVPTGGAIRFGGRDITRPVQKRGRELQRHIQLVLQNPDASLNPRQRVSEVIGRPLELFFGQRGTGLRKRVEQLLEDVRLNGTYARRFPDELSGGERQRVAIARALAADPRLMLCDEVLSALDMSVQAEVLDLLRALQAEHELAYLFISHDLAVVRSLAHQVVVLYRGEVCEFGKVDEVFDAPFHPYTHMLLLATPELQAVRRMDTEVAVPTIESTDREGLPPACPFARRCPWKVGSVCDDVPPPWRTTSDSHAVRCHLSLEELHLHERWTNYVKALESREATNALQSLET